MNIIPLVRNPHSMGPPFDEQRHAIQFDGSNLDELIEFFRVRRPTASADTLAALEGMVPGDWLVGTEHGCWSVPVARFALLYEKERE